MLSFDLETDLVEVLLHEYLVSAPQVTIGTFETATITEDSIYGYNSKYLQAPETSTE